MQFCYLCCILSVIINILDCPYGSRMYNFTICLYFVESCLDIYRQDCRSPSGEYVLYQGYSAIKVYCSFERDVIGDTAYGYTFISRRSSMESFDIRSLYTTSKFAKLRSLDLTNNQQTDVIVENHSAYSEFDLSFTINGNQNYKGPLETNNGLHPYIFLGFLPKSQSSKNTDQGFRAAGTDYTFTNCDSEPNSYIAFYFDPNIGTWGHNEESNPNFMQNWIRQSKSIAYPYHMDGAFYMHWEMQMGGSCGGFQTSSTINKKAAVGLPFGR